MKQLFSYFVICCFFYPPLLVAQKNDASLIDNNATSATKALYRNLDNAMGKHILFGHQHATEYGHGWPLD